MCGKSTREQLPIDRGWAWVITFAACGTFGIVSGHFKSQGVIYVELLERFPDASAQSLLWVFGLWNLINRLCGPLSGILLAKTSTRTVSIAGVLLMSSCLVFFAYLPRYEYMFPVYGVAGGFGAGMIALAGITAHVPYFDKRKALSIAITSSGSGIGASILPLLLRYLFDNYSWSNAILLYAGVFLQLLTLSALLRPFSFYARQTCDKEAPGFEMDESNSTKFHKTSDTGIKDFRQRSQSSGACDAPAKKISIDNSESKMFLSLSTIPIRMENGNVKERSNSILSYSVLDLTAEGQAFKKAPSLSGKPLNDKGEKSSLWSVARSPKTLAIGLASTFYIVGFANAFQCLPPLGESSGVPKKLIATLLSVFGLTEIPFRLLNGWLADRRYISPLTQLSINMITTGVAAIVGSQISGTAGVVILAAAFSMTGSSVFNLIPVVNGELMGAENVQAATAVNYGFQGIGGLISTLSAGALFEATKKWENVYFFISGCCITAGLIVLSIRIFTHFYDKRQTNS